MASDTCPAPTPSSSDPPTDLDLPISLSKGTHRCTIPKSSYPLANFVAYDHFVFYFHLFYCHFSSSCSSIPKTVKEALSHHAMLEEIRALEENQTWVLVYLPPDKNVVGCKWAFAVKVNPVVRLPGLRHALLPKDMLILMESIILTLFH